MKDYQEIRANLIDMLEDLDESLDAISKEEKLSENKIDKASIEIETALLTDDRFNLKSVTKNTK